MEAVIASEVIAIHGEDFLSVVAGTPELKELAQNYIVSLCAAISSSASDNDDIMSDLDLPVSSQLVARDMPQRFRTMMSTPAWSHLRMQNRGWFNSENKGVMELVEEISEGKCDLMLDRHGMPIRSVSVVVVELRRSSDGAVLMELWKGGSEKVEPKKPAVLRKAGESSKQACRRLLTTRLNLFSEQITIMDTDTSQEEIKEKVSRKFGFVMTSRYFRDVFHASFDVTVPRLLSDFSGVGHIFLENGNLVCKSQSSAESIDLGMDDKIQARLKHVLSEHPLGSEDVFLIDDNSRRTIFMWDRSDAEEVRKNKNALLISALQGKHQESSRGASWESD
eukprot:gnl/MRDRNA2_/MRDRNA2_24651_c0_seq1.p1 gnl/MRDRNA2_/MRDRNA2_24651_c0~~gnl/MRDRNA2_/MRDRNA2_24651_c0_seq1.p1  ORF type:complete len:359 (+),score=45.91 gnl/MRDRNA2_/MRDRNA2_24651_c0_seq1:70-1077(+)